MVTIEVDEAYAFDFLSIIAVKVQKKLYLAEEQFNQQYANLENQIGPIFKTIIVSDEYLELIRLNEEIFDKLEIVRKSSENILASEIDDLNTKRYIIKKNLQLKFFNRPVKEVKSE